MSDAYSDPMSANQAPRNTLTYQGVTYPSYQALARHLAVETRAKFHQIRKLLSTYSGDVEQVLAHLRRNTITYQGVTYHSYQALARHLAAETGAKFHQIRNLLSTYSGDVDRVVAHLQSYNGTGITIEYKGVTYRSKRALAKVLAAEFDANRQNIQTMLSAHDLEYVVEHLQNPKAIVYDGVTYRSRRTAAQAIAAKTGATFTKVQHLLSQFNDNVEQVLAHPNTNTTPETTNTFLAQQLARETGGNAESIRWLLWACGGDVEMVRARIRRGS
jgi:hypothetical protein